MSVTIGRYIVLFAAVFLFIAGDGLAGSSPKNISTQSALAYLSGGGRYAETEDADTVLNNHAGAAFMDDGFYFHLSSVIASNRFDYVDVKTGTKYENPSFGVIPDFAITYKKNKWAVFQTITFPGGEGGGELEPDYRFDYAARLYSDLLGQTVTAENQETEFYGGKGAISLGGAYQICDVVSLGIAMRAVYFQGSIDAKATLVNQETGQVVGDLRLNQTHSGWGYGYSLGMLFNYDKFKIGMRFDPEVRILAEATIEPDDTSGVVDGSKSHEDMPAIFMTGATYQLTPKLKVGGGFVYVWQKGTNGDDEPITEQWENAWELIASVEYALTPEWELLAGINYVDIGVPEDAYTTNQLSFANAWSFNFGTQWRPIPRWTFIFGLGYSYYPDEPVTEGDFMGNYRREVGRPVFKYLVGIEYKM